MGCACSRTHLSRDKNDTRTKSKHDNETDLGNTSLNKYLKITNSNDTETTIRGDHINECLNNDLKSKKRRHKNLSSNYESSNLSKSSQKLSSTNSILKPFTNLFSLKDKRSSSNTLTDSLILNCSEPNGTSQNAQPVSHSSNQLCVNLDDSNRNSQSQLRSLSQQPLSVYSIYNLPIRTQYLLNSHDDIEKLNVFYQSSEHESSKQNSFKKLNNEIQLYISLPDFNNDLETSNDNLLKSNLKLVTKHIVDDYLKPGQDVNELQNSCLFDYLRFYCAQHKNNNCDLNVINLNCYNRRKNSTKNKCDFDLSNKYFRRALGVAILNDLLNIKKNGNFYNHQYNRFLSSYSIFVIYLSESQIEQETLDDLLCPDQIDINDYRNHLEKKLQSLDLIDLFQKYYKLDKNLQSYCLEIDFFNSQSFCDDLKRLYDFFIKIEVEFLSQNETSFRLKYLKSIQQQEIEIIVKHSDPQSIIWVNMTKSDANYNRSNSVDFNQMRYTNILNLLQSKVLTNKYKHFSSENLHSSSQGPPENVLNEFIYNSVKALIDNFTIELIKNQNEMIALKIDKQLSEEIFKHYNYFSYLRRLKFSNSSSFKLESILHEYLNDKSSSYSHPLIIYNDSNNECSNDSKNHAESNNCLNILMSKWLNKLIDSNSQKLSDFNAKPSIIYRYCNHSILSSDLITLIQSILHQLCYIIGIHEACAFDCPETLYENISKGLDNYFSKADNDRKEILIILNNLDSLIKTKHECNQIELFLTKLYSNLKQSRLKLILTFSTMESSQDLIDSLNNFFSSFKKTINPINFNFQCSNQYTKFQNQILKNSKFQKMLNLTNYLLSQFRYGIKQSEFLDLMTSSNEIIHLEHSDLNQSLNLIWYAIKYFTNSLGILNENNQLLFRVTLENNPNQIEFNEFVYLFYNRSDSKLSQKTKMITNFKNRRVFHELPKCFYQTNKELSLGLKDVFIKEFILNPKWLLNKSYMCSSILYILHDLNYFKSLFNIDDEENQKLKQFENFLFNNLYNLNQDQNQLYLMTKLDTQLEHIFTNLDFFNKSNNLNSYPQLFKIRENNFLDRAYLYHLDHLNKELNFFSKILYLSKGFFLTLSEQPYNEIKIWKICSYNFLDHRLELIRTIKFNKTPKDVRLINKHTAVVLIERNLHLIDLNKCVHLFDLNSTMNPNLALFELHDSNHVVLLARNRLSVILMKVPSNENEIDIVDHEKTTPFLNSSSNNDNMFLFKVGEDRYLNSLLVSKNGKIMVCGDEVQKPFPLLVWNLNQRKLVYDLRQAKHEFITSISSISSSGKYVVSACQEEGEPKNCLIVYDLTTGQLYKKLKAKENFVSVEISEESNVIIACLENSQIFVYNLEDGSKKFTINSNRFPVNKIKLLDSNEFYKNYFLTYDTHGYDLTIRLWDMTKGDQLISSVTCPSRIISLDVNSSVLNFDNLVDKETANCETQDQLFITACLFGIKELYMIKLDYYTNKNKNSKVVFHDYCDDNSLNGLIREINLYGCSFSVIIIDEQISRFVEHTNEIGRFVDEQEMLRIEFNTQSDLDFVNGLPTVRHNVAPPLHEHEVEHEDELEHEVEDEHEDEDENKYENEYKSYQNTNIKMINTSAS
ncbi:unnamed protein product [Brachionus calyciflorus]|uniref:Uncharacterized protein n=1 Tax=Brachionus calyciflorus TaxID=104777 RepID=A0A813MCW5_9BILA|nr:unnamed protein product [Brachionus calyciflorus]